MDGGSSVNWYNHFEEDSALSHKAEHWCSPDPIPPLGKYTDEKLLYIEAPKSIADSSTVGNLKNKQTKTKNPHKP